MPQFERRRRAESASPQGGVLQGAFENWMDVEAREVNGNFLQYRS